MDFPAPAERAASQSADDRPSSLLFLCQQLNVERDLPRLLDLMAREVARLLAAERAFFCGTAPPTNCGLWWRSKVSRYAWLTDKTPDDHATASWNSIVKKSRGCFWCWIFEAMAGAGSAFAERCTLVRSSYPLLRASFTQFQPIFR